MDSLSANARRAQRAGSSAGLAENAEDLNILYDVPFVKVLLKTPRPIIIAKAKKQTTPTESKERRLLCSMSLRSDLKSNII